MILFVVCFLLLCAVCVYLLSDVVCGCSVFAIGCCLALSVICLLLCGSVIACWLLLFILMICHCLVVVEDGVRCLMVVVCCLVFAVWYVVCVVCFRLVCARYWCVLLLFVDCLFGVCCWLCVVVN